MTMHYLPPIQQRPMAPQGTINQPNGADKYHGIDGADKYYGDTVEKYDVERDDSPKWVVEQGIIEGWIRELPAGSAVLDVPVGTGRFIKSYLGASVKFYGADKSGDKLYVAARKRIGPEAKRWVDSCGAWVGRIVAVGHDGNVITDGKGRPLLTGEEVSLNIDGTEPPLVGTKLGINNRPAILGVDPKKLQPIDLGGKGVLLVADIRKLEMPDKWADCSIMCRLSRWLSPDDCQVAMRELMRVTKSRIIWTARVANHVHARTVDLFEAALKPNGWVVSRNEAGYTTDYRILEARPA